MLRCTSCASGGGREEVTKKKAKPKAPAYLTDAASLQPFGVQAGQLVKTQLGCTASVLGLKASAEGGQLWVRYASGQDAPLDMASLKPCAPAEQLRLDIDARRREQQALDDAWAKHNEEQARAAEAAAKAAAKKKKKPTAAAEQTAAAEMAAGEQAAAGEAAAEQGGQAAGDQPAAGGEDVVAAAGAGLISAGGEGAVAAAV